MRRDRKDVVFETGFLFCAAIALMPGLFLVWSATGPAAPEWKTWRSAADPGVETLALPDSRLMLIPLLSLPAPEEAAESLGNVMVHAPASAPTAEEALISASLFLAPR